jgi:hypothetical protein
MSIRIEPDKNKPFVAIEIPIEKPLPDYDLHAVERPTPRDIDALLVSQGFRDLVDDARGVLMELLRNPPPLPTSSKLTDLNLADISHFEIAQLTGAICPGDDEVYRPGLWIVLQDKALQQKQGLHELDLEHVRAIIGELVKRLSL